MLQQIVAICLVLGLLITTLALFRKRSAGAFSSGLMRRAGRPKEMQVIERIGLSPQHSLHLVNVRNDVFLIGVSPSGCNKIASFAGSGQGVDLQELER